MLLRSPLISPGAVHPFHKNMLNHFATDMGLASRMYGGNSLFYQHPYRAVLKRKITPSVALERDIKPGLTLPALVVNSLDMARVQPVVEIG